MKFELITWHSTLRVSDPCAEEEEEKEEKRRGEERGERKEERISIVQLKF